jgi:DNA-3-methyladenine glycosylase
MIVQQDFFDRPTLTVARDLLGQQLIREIDGQRLSGRIVETEAYIGPDDTASHASKGRTARTEIMFGPPGYTYVYFIYGMHYMLNFITEGVDFPAAVLIRALEPLSGQTAMQTHRQRVNHSLLKPVNLTNGPGRLCQALRIDKTLNNWPVTSGQKLWLEQAEPVPAEEVAVGPRVGIAYARPGDRIAPWRFWVRDNPFVSRGNSK